MNWQSRVSQMIAERSQGRERPDRIFLDPEDYKAFEAECKAYVDQHNPIFGLLISEDAFRDGYENIMFQAVAICRGPEKVKE